MNTWKQMLALATACGRRLLEALPEKVADKTLAAGALEVTGFGVFPATVIAAGVGDLALKHFENRAHPGALASLFRKSLLHAFRTCPPDSKGLFGASDADLSLLRLWENGLELHGDSDPGWTALLEEAVPTEVARAVSVEVGDESSYWPSLSALLARCTRWFAPGDEAQDGLVP